MDDEEKIRAVVEWQQANGYNDLFAAYSDAGPTLKGGWMPL